MAARHCLRPNQPFLTLFLLATVAYMTHTVLLQVRLKELVAAEYIPSKFGGNASCPGIDTKWDFPAARAAAQQARLKLEQEARRLAQEPHF